MVLISEISVDVANTEHQRANQPSIPEESRQSSETNTVSPVPAAAFAATIVKNSIPLTSPSGTTTSNDYAKRVAHILSRPNSTPASVPPERCRAMMEVILDGDQWTTSKLVTDHNHELSPSLAAGRESPAIGMGFESTEAAKAFYFSYGDRAGFQPRIGSSRRSDDGSLIMQRFLCWRGDHHMYKKNTNSVTRKQKSGPYMGPYRKIAPKMQMVAPAAVENNAQPAEKGERMDVHMCKKSAHAVMRKPKGKSGPYVGPYRKIAPRMPMAAPAAVENNAQPAEKGERTYASHAVDTTKSHVLREPGVRVQQYTNEERRDIILKYMKKRSNRPAVERPNKIPSQPTLGDGLQHGIAGSAHDDRGHAVQRPYVPGHQFGLGQIQDFHRMNHFTQDSLVSALQQPPFHAGGQLAQDNVQACTGAPDAPSLQFVPTPNPQLSHPSDEQGNYSIPVWDFL